MLRILLAGIIAALPFAAVAQGDPSEEMRYAAIIMTASMRLAHHDQSGTIDVTSPNTAEIKKSQVAMVAVPNEPCVFEIRYFKDNVIWRFDFNRLTSRFTQGLRGSPVIFYGDRVMCGGTVPSREMSDPVSHLTQRNCLNFIEYPGRDGGTFLDAVTYFQTTYCPAAIPKPF